jgi:hypothetical protein
MSMNLGVFKEPRGVMRILQFVSYYFLNEVSALFYTKIPSRITYGIISSSQQIFSICAFATTTGFSSYVAITDQGGHLHKLEYSYPFR